MTDPQSDALSPSSTAHPAEATPPRAPVSLRLETIRKDLPPASLADSTLRLSRQLHRLLSWPMRRLFNVSDTLLEGAMIDLAPGDSATLSFALRGTPGQTLFLYPELMQGAPEGQLEVSPPVSVTLDAEGKGTCRVSITRRLSQRQGTAEVLLHVVDEADPDRVLRAERLPVVRLASDVSGLASLAGLLIVLGIIGQMIKPDWPVLGAFILPMVLGLFVFRPSGAERASFRPELLRRNGRRWWAAGSIVFALAIWYGFALIQSDALFPHVPGCDYNGTACTAVDLLVYDLVAITAAALAFGAVFLAFAPAIRPRALVGPAFLISLAIPVAMDDVTLLVDQFLNKDVEAVFAEGDYTMACDAGDRVIRLESEVWSINEACGSSVFKTLELASGGGAGVATLTEGRGTAPHDPALRDALSEALRTDLESAGIAAATDGGLDAQSRFQAVTDSFAEAHSHYLLAELSKDMRADIVTRIGAARTQTEEAIDGLEALEARHTDAVAQLVTKALRTLPDQQIPTTLPDPAALRGRFDKLFSDNTISALTDQVHARVPHIGALFDAQYRRLLSRKTNAMRDEVRRSAYRFVEEALEDSTKINGDNSITDAAWAGMVMSYVPASVDFSEANWQRTNSVYAKEIVGELALGFNIELQPVELVITQWLDEVSTVRHEIAMTILAHYGFIPIRSPYAQIRKDLRSVGLQISDNQRSRDAVDARAAIDTALIAQTAQMLQLQALDQILLDKELRPEAYEDQSYAVAHRLEITFDAEAPNAAPTLTWTQARKDGDDLTETGIGPLEARLLPGQFPQRRADGMSPLEREINAAPMGFGTNYLSERAYQLVGWVLALLPLMALAMRYGARVAPLAALGGLVATLALPLGAVLYVAALGEVVLGESALWSAMNGPGLADYAKALGLGPLPQPLELSPWLDAKLPEVVTKGVTQGLLSLEMAVGIAVMALGLACLAMVGRSLLAPTGRAALWTAVFGGALALLFTGAFGAIRLWAQPLAQMPLLQLALALGATAAVGVLWSLAATSPRRRTAPARDTAPPSDARPA